jgi:transcriptional regulator with XRE-family HTH domain
MAGKSFFTPEMGARLREIRKRRGLTLDQVAARMALKGRGRWNQVARLERGENHNPSLKLVTLFLRACGAKFAEFYDCLTRTEPGPVDTREIDRANLPRRRKDILKQKTVRQVQKYRMRTEYPLRGAPMPPCRQKPAVEKFRQYRVRVNIIQEAVQMMLGTTRAPSALYPAYTLLARQFLSVLEKLSGPKQTAKLAALVTEARERGLDPVVAGQVRTVVAQRLRLMRSRPLTRPS